MKSGVTSVFPFFFSSFEIGIDGAIFLASPRVSRTKFTSSATSFAGSVDMAFSIGGDGTLLGVCRRYAGKNVPVCGINIGTLGFLADIEVDELEKKLAKALVGDYLLEERLLIAGYISRNGREPFFAGTAINDAVVCKGSVLRMLSLGLSINKTHIMDFKADGIIVSSPTGSTAYSLSAGGPILNPNIKALLLTPICAQTFNLLGPLVVNEQDEIHIQIVNGPRDTLMTFDGQESVQLFAGDEVIVRKSPIPAKIVIQQKDVRYVLILLGVLQVIQKADRIIKLFYYVKRKRTERPPDRPCVCRRHR